MGQMLRRIGLTAGFATAAFATVVTEALAYLYRVVRWKAKLLGLIQLVLDMEPTEQPFEDAIIRSLPIIGSKQRLPVEELRQESRAAIGEAMASTRKMVEDNFARRAEVLRDALEQRSDGEFKRLETLSSRLLDLHTLFLPRV